MDLHLKSRTARVSTGVQTEMFAKLLYDAWSCLQRVLVLSIFIMGWHLSGVARASDPKHDWIVEVFVKDDNALVTGALLNYRLKAPNSATATATAKKDRNYDTDTCRLPVGWGPYCHPLHTLEITAHGKTLHCSCDRYMWLSALTPGRSFELPIELQTRSQDKVITLTATMNDVDSDAGKTLTR